ncbi:hypothetical protein PV682_13210 [Streptomyces niveiscabiei]|nr:hypothetical protein [Streptomyces niveiscabiei]
MVGIAARVDARATPARVGRPGGCAPGSRRERREPYCFACASHAAGVLCENEGAAPGGPPHRLPGASSPLRKAE